MNPVSHQQFDVLTTALPGLDAIPTQGTGEVSWQVPERLLRGLQSLGVLAFAPNAAGRWELRRDAALTAVFALTGDLASATRIVDELEAACGEYLAARSPWGQPLTPLP